MGATSSSLPTRCEWSCACGEFTVGFAREPRQCFDCNCQSCTGFAEAAAAKGGGTEAFARPAGHAARGTAKAAYFLGDVDRLPEGAAGKLWYATVGGGAIVRSATKCCNTPFNTAGGAAFPAPMRPFNRNALKCADGKTPFTPAGPVLQIMAKHAADPSAVPKPKNPGAPLSLLKTIAASFLAASGPHSKDPCFFADPKKDPPQDLEDIPKTWTNEKA